MSDAAERYRRAKAVLFDALERPASERAAFVAGSCGDDDALRREVEGLLAYADEPDVESAGEDLMATDAAPQQIGRYRLVRLIGEGGMGRVYEAEQDIPKRRVALKVLRGALIDAASRRRFALEAEFLGRLQHPGIARIYDAGGTDDEADTPFLVMELVEGRELARWIAEEQPSRDARIRLWITVCDAVEHAHRHGVIHRDLKPSNILVDTDGHARILDFGIARAIDDDARRTALTDAGQLVGTLAYMSPEQCVSGSANVETRSDVYALGVIGYEMLTGRLPIDVDGLPLGEAVRRIQDGATRPLATDDRGLRGDLATVVHTALETDPARRYPSAMALADDLRAILDGAPIRARPASTFYQVRRFVGRHRLLVASAILAATALVVGSGLALWWAAAERDARVAAERSEDGLDRINAFMIDMLQAPSPLDLGRDAPLSELLERAEGQVDERFADRPDMRAEVLQILGKTWLSIGDDARGAALYERAVAARREAAGPGRSTPELALALAAWGNALWNADRQARALEVIDEAIVLSTEHFGADSTRTERARLDRTVALSRLERPAEALAEAEAILARVDDSPTADAALRRDAAAQVARLKLDTADFEGARVSMERAIRHSTPDAPDSRYTHARLLGELAVMAFRAGDRDAAARHLEGQVETLRTLIQGDHPMLAVALSNRGSLLRAGGDLPGAEACYEEALAMSRRIESEPTRTLAINLHNLGALYQATGRPEEALGLLREARGILEAVAGPDSTEVAGAVGVIGDCLATLDDRKGAVECHRRVVEIQERARGAAHLETVHAGWVLVGHEVRAGEIERAQRLVDDLVGVTGDVGRQHIARVLRRALITAEEIREPSPQMADRIAAAVQDAASEAKLDTATRDELLAQATRVRQSVGTNEDAGR